MTWHVAGPGVDNLVFVEFQNRDVLIGYVCSSQLGRAVFILFLQYKFSMQWLIELCDVITIGSFQFLSCVFLCLLNYMPVSEKFYIFIYYNSLSEDCADATAQQMILVIVCCRLLTSSCFHIER